MDVLACVLVSHLAAACLPEPQAPPGVQLYRGQNVERLTTVSLPSGIHVRFELRRSLPRDGASGRVDTLLVPADGSRPARVVLSDRADASRFPLIDVDGRGRRFLAIQGESAFSVAGQIIRSGTLVRFDLEGGIEERTENVTSYGLVRNGSWNGTLWVQRPVLGAQTVESEFVMRDAEGRVRTLSGLIGTPIFDPSGVIYYLSTSNRVLYRVRGLDGAPEPLRAGVSRLQVSETHAALAVADNERPVNVIFDLETLSETRLPGERICCWHRFEGCQRNAPFCVFIYAEGAGSGLPARYWVYDIQRGVGGWLDMPPGMVDVVGEMGRPGTSEHLFFDSRNNVARFNPDAPPGERLRLLPIHPAGPRFIAGGRLFIYVEPIPGDIDNEGRLMVMPGDFGAPPRLLSPPHTKLSPAQRMFEMADNRGTADPSDDRHLLVFWARFGRTASDLYFADLDTFEVERVAEGIREVSVTAGTLLGIVRTSLQDLVGDLVWRDLRTGTERIIAHSVDNFTLVDIGAERMVLYYRRGRTSGDFDGIWLVPLRPFLE